MSTRFTHFQIALQFYLAEIAIFTTTILGIPVRTLFMNNGPTYGNLQLTT